MGLGVVRGLGLPPNIPLSHRRGADRQPSATLRLGYQRPLAHIIQSFASTRAGKDKSLQVRCILLTCAPIRPSVQPVAEPPVCRACAWQEYCGIFYYHKGRLIRPLVRTKQQRAEVRSQLYNTRKRLCVMGYGLVGVCCECVTTN